MAGPSAKPGGIIMKKKKKTQQKKKGMERKGGVVHLELPSAAPFRALWDPNGLPGQTWSFAFSSWVGVMVVPSGN